MARRPSSTFPVLAPLAKFAVTGTIVAAAIYAARARRRMDFNGKTVLISGGSRGLGLELARAFAEEGANLVLLARDEAKLACAAAELQRRHGTNISTFICDISKQDQVHEVIPKIVGKM